MVDFQCKERYDYADLLQIMKVLRAPGGCPWDGEQTHESIRRDFLEETCEAVEAIDRADMTGLCEELGDVLLQVVFHAQIETEKGGFTMDDVVNGICQKLVYRHPHVFGQTQVSGSDEVLVNWDVLKGRKRDRLPLPMRWMPWPVHCPACGGQKKFSPRRERPDLSGRTCRASWRRKWRSCVKRPEAVFPQMRPMASVRKWVTCCLWLFRQPESMVWIRRMRCIVPAINLLSGFAGQRSWQAAP